MGGDQPRQTMFAPTGGRVAAEHEVYKSIILYMPFLSKVLTPLLIQYCLWLLSMIIPVLDFHHQIVNSDSPIKIITVVSAMT